MDLGAHSGFIIAAYAATVLVIGGLIWWVMRDHRAQTRLLAELDARGITRRSSAGDARI